MKGLLIPIMLLATSSVLADQKGPEWNYFEIGYSESELGDFEPNGAFGKFSVLFNERMYLTGSWSELGQDILINGRNTKLKLNDSRIGMGTRYGLNETTDIFGSLGYVNIEDCTIDGQCDDDDGLNVNVGLSTFLMNKVELSIAADYVDAGGESETFGVFGASYNFTEDFSLKLTYQSGDDLDIASLSARLEF